MGRTVNSASNGKQAPLNGDNANKFVVVNQNPKGHFAMINFQDKVIKGGNTAMRIGPPLNNAMRDMKTQYLEMRIYTSSLKTDQL